MGSRFQRFLWTVAGAELDILEKCRTDHKKFAAIGATILMTAFIAFCAGTSAAWYFTQSGDETSGSLISTLSKVPCRRNICGMVLYSKWR